MLSARYLDNSTIVHLYTLLVVIPRPWAEPDINKNISIP